MRQSVKWLAEVPIADSDCDRGTSLGIYAKFIQKAEKVWFVVNSFVKES